MIKHQDLSNSLRKRFIRLIFPDHNPSLKKDRTGTWKQNPHTSIIYRKSYLWANTMETFSQLRFFSEDSTLCQVEIKNESAQLSLMLSLKIKVSIPISIISQISVKTCIQREVICVDLQEC